MSNVELAQNSISSLSELNEISANLYHILYIAKINDNMTFDQLRYMHKIMDSLDKIMDLSRSTTTELISRLSPEEEAERMNSSIEEFINVCWPTLKAK